MLYLLTEDYRKAWKFQYQNLVFSFLTYVITLLFLPICIVIEHSFTNYSYTANIYIYNIYIYIYKIESIESFVRWVSFFFKISLISLSQIVRLVHEKPPSLRAFLLRWWVTPTRLWNKKQFCCFIEIFCWWYWSYFDHSYFIFLVGFWYMYIYVYKTQKTQNIQCKCFMKV